MKANLKDIFLLMDQHKLWNKNIRIVKGSGVYDDVNLLVNKERERAVQERYLEILRRNTRAGRAPFVATVRDSRLAELIIELEYKGRCSFEFQMLYGPLGRKLGGRLLRMGYPVRIYIPFTDYWCQEEWRAYGLRRAKMIRRILCQELLLF